MEFPWLLYFGIFEFLNLRTRCTVRGEECPGRDITVMGVVSVDDDNSVMGVLFFDLSLQLLGLHFFGRFSCCSFGLVSFEFGIRYRNGRGRSIVWSEAAGKVLNGEFHAVSDADNCLYRLAVQMLGLILV